MEMKTLAKTRLQKLKQIVDIQSSRGNYDYDNYMFGMANGLILAYHIMSGQEQEECPYLESPFKTEEKV